MWRTPNIKTKLFCATWVLLNVVRTLTVLEQTSRVIDVAY